MRDSELDHARAVMTFEDFHADAMYQRNRSLTRALRDVLELSEGTSVRAFWLIAGTLIPAGMAMLQRPRDPFSMLLFAGISIACLSAGVAHILVQSRIKATAGELSTRFRAAGLIVEGESSSRTATVSDAAWKKLAEDALTRFAARAPVSEEKGSNKTYTFAWTPPGSRLGSIVLAEKPSQLFTRADYNAALATRLQMLFDGADDEDRSEVIRKVERQEPFLKMTAEPGWAMVSNSEWLRERVYFPAEGVAPVDMEHEPETLMIILDKEEDILSYVAELYHDPD